jgi:hypothetical protein
VQVFKGKYFSVYKNYYSACTVTGYYVIADFVFEPWFSSAYKR